jgi:uncharacterized membrane protein
MDTSSISPHRLASERGLGWITDGWKLFAQAPGEWLLLTLVSLGVMLVTGMVPLLGSLASPFVSALVMAGLLRLGRAQQTGTKPGVGALFDILSDARLKPLLITTLIYVALCFAAILLVAMVFGLGGGAMALIGGALGGEDAAIAGMGGAALMGVLVLILLITPVLAMYWFALPLVLFREMEPWEAMKTSLAAVLANMLPLLVYGLVGAVLGFLALIPFGLGLLVFVPVMLLSWLLSYQEMFAD